mmetsp:Transcript_21565/g.40287  ORF Transcript_21565/g.40287 Transcript_21565/m.40287 type:complete len:207 (-) Transcript_21565:65-685(-)
MLPVPPEPLDDPGVVLELVRLAQCRRLLEELRVRRLLPFPHRLDGVVVHVDALQPIEEMLHIIGRAGRSDVNLLHPPASELVHVVVVGLSEFGGNAASIAAAVAVVVGLSSSALLQPPLELGAVAAFRHLGKRREGEHPVTHLGRRVAVQVHLKAHQRIFHFGIVAKQPVKLPSGPVRHDYRSYLVYHFPERFHEVFYVRAECLFV